MHEAMAFPLPDYSKRDYLLPEGCKDVTDLLKREAVAASAERQDPPITKRVTLPEIVSVRFLAQITGQQIEVIIRWMWALRICVDKHRSVSFEEAEKVLRKFGVGADREGPAE